MNLIGESFRHDFESDDEEGLEPSDRAHAFLVTLLGGVDDFLQDRVFARKDECEEQSDGLTSIKVVSASSPIETAPSSSISAV